MLSAFEETEAETTKNKLSEVSSTELNTKNRARLEHVRPLGLTIDTYVLPCIKPVAAGILIFLLFFLTERQPLLPTMFHMPEEPLCCRHRAIRGAAFLNPETIIQDL